MDCRFVNLFTQYFFIKHIILDQSNENRVQNSILLQYNLRFVSEIVNSFKVSKTSNINEVSLNTPVTSEHNC